MGKILCWLSFHDPDWYKFKVMNAFGDAWIPCKRCDDLDAYPGDMVAEALLYLGTKEALESIRK